MSKAFFRFLRGELNGFYLKSIYNTLNESTKHTKAFLMDFNNMQFKKGMIDDTTLLNIGKFAGVFPLNLVQTESLISLRMSDSKVVEGFEYSERGLFNKALEIFNYYHLNLNAEETEDINTLATEEERSSLVGEEEVVGYIAEDETDVLDSQGKIRPEKILYEVPEGKAYSEFYGDQFLFLSEGEEVYSKTSNEIFLDLYKALQYIRYNSVSLKSLAQLVTLICPQDLVKIDHIEVAVDKTHFNAYYNYNAEVNVTYKAQRKALLEVLVAEKFKQVVLVENEKEK